jgi:hypothetical protein
VSGHTPSREALAAMREERIFAFCRRSAEQIIGELELSNGDHGEDIEILEGLIETWSELEFQHRHFLETEGAV